jgi:anaerobic magnesium-protoporphyrin IX monomethyl ester cyclase
LNVAIVNLATGQSHTMAPLGALYIVASLEQAGASVTFKDYALERGPDLFSCDRLARFCLEAADDASLLGVSCFAGMLPYAVEACGLIRRARPDLRIVLGGPGPSATPADILDAFPSIDFVAFGEGEATAIELVSTLASPTFAGSDPALGKIEGLAWRDGAGRTIVNPARQRRGDLDDIPFPAYHHVRLDAYDIVGVVTTRGCPYACTYCDVVSMWKRRSIARSVENVIAEIEWLHGAFGVRHVACVDDLFTVDRRRTLEITDALARTGPLVTWGCTTRVDRTDDEILGRMAAAGCRYVFFGVESGSAKVLARVNKVVPFDHTCRSVRRGVALGMYVHAPLMWGFPFEDMTDFQETLGFGRMLEALGGHVFYTLATPLPATALYREFRERLLFDGELYSTIIAPGRLTDLSEVQHLIRRHTNIFPGFYHFADGRVHEKIAVGCAARVTLGDIRISNLVEAPAGTMPS